jgi:hypothetical protein
VHFEDSGKLTVVIWLSYDALENWMHLIFQHVKELKSQKLNKRGEVHLQREKPAALAVSLESSLSRVC